jgi:hypothetical protein
MADPRKPLHPTDKKPGNAPDIAETDVPTEVLPEGQIPGLPVSSDPLLQPMPHPANRQVPPLD